MKEIHFNEQIKIFKEQEFEMRDVKSSLKKSQLQLKQIRLTKLKDMERTIKDKDKTIGELNQRLKDILNGTTNTSKSPNPTRRGLGASSPVSFDTGRIRGHSSVVGRKTSNRSGIVSRNHDREKQSGSFAKYGQ